MSGSNDNKKEGVSFCRKETYSRETFKNSRLIKLNFRVTEKEDRPLDNSKDNHQAFGLLTEDEENKESKTATIRVRAGALLYKRTYIVAESRHQQNHFTGDNPQAIGSKTSIRVLVCFHHLHPPIIDSF